MLEQDDSAKPDILVVEDDPAMLELIVDMLESLGHQAILSASGTDAMQVFKQNRIRIMFTDLIMPGDVTGIDLARWAKDLQPDLKIVLMSGYGAAEAQRLLDNAPIDDCVFITKPFRKVVLTEILANFLD